MIPDQNFGVRELGPAFSAADSSADCHSPRPVAASKSGDESPHSESLVRAPRLHRPPDTLLSRTPRSSKAEALHFENPGEKFGPISSNPISDHQGYVCGWRLTVN